MPLNLDRPGPMGWGDETDTAVRTSYLEHVQRDRNYAERPARMAPPQVASTPLPLREEIADALEFDAGFAFWPCEKMLYGDPLLLKQYIGSCVGHSHVGAIASKIAAELTLEGDFEDVSGSEATSYIPHVGYSYGCGRVFVGNGRLRGDGSLCAWQIRATLDYGFLPCDSEVNTKKLQGPYPEGTESETRDFGRSKGLLEQWRPAAEPYEMASSWDVESAEDLYQAIVIQKQPCQICSNWGFAHWGERDGMTIYRKRGSWAHSMAICALVCVGGSGEGLGNGGKWYVWVRNQWGAQAHRVVGRGVPSGGFMITIDEFSSWVRKAHCAAIGEIQGRAIDPLDL